MSELKPCPFCDGQVEHEGAPIKLESRLLAYKFTCGLCGNWVFVVAKDIIHAIELYNTRPVEDALLEALKKVKGYICSEDHLRIAEEAIAKAEVQK